jgi:hypothetical protein
MGAIAQRTFGAMLAAAKIHGSRYLCLVFHGGKIAALMAAIAEWLVCTFAAGTPPVTLACFYCDCIRGFLGDDGLLGRYIATWHIITGHVETPF